MQVLQSECIPILILSHLSPIDPNRRWHTITQTKPQGRVPSPKRWALPKKTSGKSLKINHHLP